MVVVIHQMEKITSENEYKSWLDVNKMNYKIPSEMSLILGGETWIGSESGLANEKPVFQTKVQPFFNGQNDGDCCRF